MDEDGGDDNADEEEAELAEAEIMNEQKKPTVDPCSQTSAIQKQS